MVNEKMLVKLLEKTQFMAVFFCKWINNTGFFDAFVTYAITELISTLPTQTRFVSVFV